jgi:hypothetical protein
LFRIIAALGLNRVFGALNRADGKIQFIQARHGVDRAAVLQSGNRRDAV